MDVSLQGMEAFAEDFVAHLPTSQGARAHMVGLAGDLGAGKTTFVQRVARSLGVRGEVTSPTFVIAQRYETTHPVFTSLVHIDAYRLLGEEKDTFGFQAYSADPHTLVLVEWPTNLPKGAQLPTDAPVLYFETVNETTRRITQKAV